MELVEIMALWNEGRAKLVEALELARKHKIYSGDRTDMAYAIDHVFKMDKLSKNEKADAGLEALIARAKEPMK